MNGTMMMTMNPTNVSDSSDQKEESVEVGVIVMGLCCICLVACALVVLQLRSNNRRISGNRQRSGPTGNDSADRSRDPLDVEAPPSYDAVIRSPHLYPPSRRTSLTLDISETRRSSGSSAFSLSVHSPRLIHHLRVVPRGLSEDNLSQHTDIQLWGSQEEDNEEPPPPYPGNSTSCDAGTTDYIVSPRPTRPDTIAHGENRPRPSGERGSAIRSNQEHHEMGPNRAHVVNAWIDSEEVHRISRGETNSEPCRPNICQPTNPEDRNLGVNAGDPNCLRTFVSHSLQDSRGVVSTTHTVPSVNAELTEAV